MSDTINLEKPRREVARLLILRALYAARPIEASDLIVLRILSDFHLRYTLDEVRREFDYLASLGLAQVDEEEPGGWWARATALGIAVVEQNAPVPVGIAKPR